MYNFLKCVYTYNIINLNEVYIMSNNNKNYYDDNYIDFSIDKITVNHLVFFISVIFAIGFYTQIDHKSLYLGNEFMCLFFSIGAIYNMVKIFKNIKRKKRYKDVIRVDYKYSNRF